MQDTKIFTCKMAAVFLSLVVLCSLPLAGAVPVDPELTQGATWDYIIITKETFADDFQTLAEFRYKQGLKTAIFTTDGDDGIYETYSDVDDYVWIQTGESPRQIRAFLQDMYNEHGLEYVLIGGDPDVVPVRYSYGWINDFGEGAINGSIATDLYYSAGLDSSLDWELQNYYYCPHLDNYFMGFEPPPSPSPEAKDYFEIDLKLGRACIDTATEIANYTSKVMAYENATEDEHLNRATFLASEQAHVTSIEKYKLETVYDSNGEVSSWSPDFSSTMNIERLYIDGSFKIDDFQPTAPATPTPTQCVYYATPSPTSQYQVLGNACTVTNVNTALNAGTNICLWGGHGWVSHFPELYYLNTHAYNLDADGKYGGLFFTSACETAAFDAGASYIENEDDWDEDCIGESFLKSVDGGFTNYLGYTRSTMIFSDTLFHVFFDKLFDLSASHADEPLYYTVGNLYSLAKQALIDEYEDDLDIEVNDYGYNVRSNLMALTLLGDPAVSLYTAEPETFTVSHTSTLTHGSPTVMYVGVQCDSTPVADVLVCLYKEDDVFETASTNYYGLAYLGAINAGSSGTLYVTATLHNYKRYSGTITVN